MDDMDKRLYATVVLGLIGFTLIGAIYIYGEPGNGLCSRDLCPGSMVTTTAGYEYMSNDSFSGVVVRGETPDDLALTVRNHNGTERRIATEYLKLME